MNLAHYFDPSEALPNPLGLSKDASLFGKLNKTSVTENLTIDNNTLVIFGVTESRNSNNHSATDAPESVRKYLYALSGSSIKKNLIDLGNLKQTANPADTYMAVRDVTAFLASKGATVIIIGGTQEITWPIYQAVLENQQQVNLSIADYNIDLGNNDGDFSSTCFVDKLIAEGSDKLFNLNFIGYQGYLVNSQHIKLLQSKSHELYRLGYVRSSMAEVEPTLRDSDILSFDMGCIKQSDSPGSIYPSPNGFYSEEVCQLSRYAGLSPRVKVFGVFELSTINDPSGHSSHLAAQIIWHFVDAFNQRRNGLNTTTSSEGVKRFYINSPIPGVDLIFLHNTLTDTWWIEIPESEKHAAHILACSYNDYKRASSGDVPDRWLHALKKLT